MGGIGQATERLRILPRHIRLNVGVMLRLLRVSLTGILQFGIAHTSWVGLVRIISLFGSAALAGYTVAIRIVIFAILPSWGMSNAAATLVGQNLGAREPERAETCVWLTTVYNVLFLVPGRLVNVDFMVKDSKRFADSGGWGYAVFDYDTGSNTFKPGTLAGTPPQGNDAKCGFACHTAAKTRDYVFTDYGRR